MPISIMLHMSAVSEKKPLVVIQKCSQKISRNVFSFIVARSPVADAPQQERQPLSHMPEDDLQVGVGVKYAAQDEAQPLGRGLNREAPGSTQDAGMQFT